MEVFPAVVVVVVVVAPFAANTRGRVVEVFEESKPPDTQASRRPDALLDWAFAQVQARENLACERVLSTSTGPSSSTQKRYFYMYCASAGIPMPATLLVVAASKELEVIGKVVCALLVSAKDGPLG